MKKTLALLLVLVICLSLTACGVDKKYTPLLDALNAGDYAGIKQAMAVLSPDFAAEQALMEKYGDLLALLEAEDYENALTNVTSRMPVPEEPTYHEVAITMDNWQEYFEIRDYEEYKYNDFGELTWSDTGYGIYLKEEYLNDLQDYGVDVSFKVEASVEYRECDQDWKFVPDGRIIVGAEAEKHGWDITNETVQKVWDQRYTADSKTDVSTANGQVLASFGISSGVGDGSGNYWGVFTDIVVIDVTGTLMLAD